MKEILFDRITIQNFLSVGKEPLVIDFHEGFNVITGINRDENGIKNGIGKTLIVDALYFSIFGETLRNLTKKEFIVNRMAKKGCLVTLEFRKVYFGQVQHWKIMRGIAPSGCRVWRDDTEETLSTMPETNKLIAQVLQADETLFQNCIIMRANATVPFMAKKKQEKKDFIESIFRLEIFSDMGKKLKEDIRKEKKELDVLSSNYALVKNNIENYNNEISRLSEEARTKDEEISRQVDKIRREIRSEKASLEKMRSEMPDIENIKSELNESKKNQESAKRNFEDFLKKKFQTESVIPLKSAQLKELETAGNVCPTCKREYTAEHIRHVEAKKQELLQEIKKLNARRSKMVLTEPKAREILKQIADDVGDWEEKLRKARQHADDIRSAEANIARLEKQVDIFSYQKQENTLKSLENLVEDARKKEKALLEKKKESEKNLAKMVKCEHVLGEYGVRAYIVEKLLGILNERIDYYLTQFQSMFHFEFNKVFEEQITDSNGMECQYGNCSGAESKKIDLAIAFAFSDVLKLHQRTEYNLIFFDEILDSSLDTQSLTHVVEFLHAYIKENNKAAYLITHKSDLDLPDVDETILLEKRDGLTYRWTPKPKQKNSELLA